MTSVAIDIHTESRKNEMRRELLASKPVVISGSTPRVIAPPVERPAVHPVLQLQRSIGNRATRQLIANDPGLVHRDREGSHSKYEHEDPYAKRLRSPEDEKRVNWGDYVKLTAPRDPFHVVSVVPEANAAPFPPHAVLEKPPSHHTRPASDPFAAEDKDKTIVSYWWLEQRQERWNAYREKTIPVQQMQEAVKPDIDLFFHAEKNEDLKALGFIMPKGYKGNLLDLTSQQEVPTRGGAKVGGLFRGEGSANTTKADEKAIESAGAAMRAGKGGTESAFLDALKADKDLSAAIKKMKAAAEAVVQESKAAEAAAHAVEYLNAEDEAESAKAEIEELKTQAEAARKVLEFCVAAPAKIAKLAEEGINVLEAVGTIGSFLIDTFPSAEMKAATAKLAAAQAKMKTEKAAQLQATLDSAKAGVRRALSELEANKDLVASALTARRKAYNLAATSARDVATGSAESKNKVSGLIAAIPVVETVVASLRNIAEKTASARPAYTDDAGLGYGIALYHQKWEAMVLPGVIGVLEYCNVWFGEVYGEWAERLKSARAVKERIAGTRPGD